jgi:hypothetical protein
MDQDKKEVGKWWMWGVLLVVLTSIIFTVLGYFGVFGKTFVERKVFEQSYQRSEALKTQVVTYEAQLAELETQLNNPNLDEGDRANIEAQMAAIRIQLKTARSKQ